MPSPVAASSGGWLLCRLTPLRRRRPLQLPRGRLRCTPPASSPRSRRAPPPPSLPTSGRSSRLREPRSTCCLRSSTAGPSCSRPACSSACRRARRRGSARRSRTGTTRASPSSPPRVHWASASWRRSQVALNSTLDLAITTAPTTTALTTTVARPRHLLRHHHRRCRRALRAGPSGHRHRHAGRGEQRAEQPGRPRAD